MSEIPISLSSKGAKWRIRGIEDGIPLLGKHSGRFLSIFGFAHKIEADHYDSIRNLRRFIKAHKHELEGSVQLPRYCSSRDKALKCLNSLQKRHNPISII